jgi:integrase
MATGIYKRGSVNWIRYAGTDGRMKFESCRGLSFKEAEARLADRKKQVRDGDLQARVSRPDMTFRELAEEYNAWAQRQRGIRQKRERVQQLEKVFGNVKLKHFTTMLLEQFQTDRLGKGHGTRKEIEDGKTPKGNKPATVNRLLGVLRHMFTKAHDWGFVSDDVLRRLRKVKQLEENNARLRFLSRGECRKLISACDDHLRPIVVMALNTGMRRSEILQLRWDQVDLQHGFILLSVTKNGQRREIPINAALRDVLAVLALVRREGVSFVFANKGTGKPFHQVARSFSAALREAGISDFKFHDLRHTFASHLAMAGVELITIKELLGHKDVTMTLRYAHLAPAQKRRAVDVLNGILMGAPERTIQKLDSEGVSEGIKP